MGECRHRQGHGKLRGQRYSTLVAGNGPRALSARDQAFDYRRLWRQRRRPPPPLEARELGIAITVCHLPPGTSKWNRIERRLFSFITQNRRGKPLVSHQTIVQLIAATTTDTGLKVRSEIGPNSYPGGVKVTDDEIDAINILRHKFHGDWNYTIRPQRPVRSDNYRTGPNSIHRALAKNRFSDERGISQFALHGEGSGEKIVGRILVKGLAGDEMEEQVYLVVDGIDSRVHRMEFEDPSRIEEVGRT